MKTSTRNTLRASLVTLTILALSGCGSSTSLPLATNTANIQSRLIDSPEFTLTIPHDWDVIQAQDFTSDVPPETQLVVRNNVKNDNFTANVSIIKRGTSNSIATLDYAKEVINRQKTGLLNYKEDNNSSAKIQIGGQPVDTYLETFEGKKDAQSDLIDFYQTYAVKGANGYIVTGAYSPQETTDNINAVQAVVKSFSVK
jgi:hypothetical protein